MATAVCQPELSSAGELQQAFPASSSHGRALGQASTAAREPSAEHPGLARLLPEPPSAMEKAAGMLQDLGRLKAEMQTLMQECRQSPPPCLEGHTKAASALPGRARPGDALPGEGREPAPTGGGGQSAAGALPPPPPPRVSSPKEPDCGAPPRPSLVALPRVPQPPLLQKSQPPPSMFEDAGRVLRRVQQHRRVMEENVEAVLRAKGAEALYCQLGALSCNRGAAEELRIKKTVDAWISTLSKEVQADIRREDFLARKAEGDKGDHGDSPQMDGGAKGGARLLREAKGRARTTGKNPFQREPQRHDQNVKVQHKRPEPSLKTRGPHPLRPFGVSKSEREGEEYLMKVYGKALYDGHRRTLKKAPYLRYSSPSPKSKPQRPRVVESVKGVKMKSAKTQTSLVPQRTHTVVNEPQYTFSPTAGGHNDPVTPQTPVEGLLIPMAIPLGQPRVDAGPPQLSRLFISRHPVTLATSIPLAQPKPARKPNVVVVTEVQSERKQPPQLQVQVLPSVDIDSVPSAVPSPRPPPLDIQTAEQAQEEEQNIFPGTGYLSVADISEEPEEEPVDTPIELNGSARPPTTLYHGPAYPPQPAGPLPDTEPILGTIQQRETLENRLVDWVEQQLMARMITEMYPQRVQIEQVSLSEPEESCVSSSDIVEAAGGGGLQMFVDAGVPVDSALIRRYVTDALAETIVLMLGQREGQTGPVSPAPPRDVPAAAEVVVVPTPVPTPLPSPRESPVPPSRVSPPPSTPEPSEQGSATESPRDVLPSREPQDTGPTEPERSAVATPTITPVASPPRVATPPTAPPTSQSTESAQHSKPWGDAELPLEEEVQHCKTKEPEQHNSPVMMSVAKEEEEAVSLVSLPPPVSPKRSSPPQRSPTPPLLHETPPPASSASSEESSSSLSITETDLAARHISEGELLLSSGPMAAARALAEEGLSLPAFNTSLSSSLHGVLDIDYDPPSEGQVVRRSRVQHHRDPVLSLLAKMDQGLVALQEVTHQPQGSWDEESSAGELSEGQRPRLTAVGESLLTGHSLLLDQTALGRPGAGPSPDQGRLSSPGQLPVPGGVTFASVQSSHHPITIRDLEASQTVLPRSRPITAGFPRSGDRDGDGQAPDPPAPSHRPAPILVRQYQERSEDTEEPDSMHFDAGHLSVDSNVSFQGEEQGAAFTSTSGVHRNPRAMLVTLPSAQQDEASASVSAVETDSSENDVF